MDIQPQQAQQPISDDQELAKVLAGINQNVEAPVSQEQTMAAQPVTLAPAVSVAGGFVAPTMADLEASTAQSDSDSSDASDDAGIPDSNIGDLASIKREALGELRPLVDKLEVPADEKFDTYLLLLRSTDDKTLIAPAHEAAKNIADEAKRAQALLDIIKEIDFLSGETASK